MRQMITIVQRGIHYRYPGIGTYPDIPFNILVNTPHLVIDKRTRERVFLQRQPFTLAKYFSSVGQRTDPQPLPVIYKERCNRLIFQ